MPFSGLTVEGQGWNLEVYCTHPAHIILHAKIERKCSVKIWKLWNLKSDSCTKTATQPYVLRQPWKNRPKAKFCMLVKDIYIYVTVNLCNQGIYKIPKHFLGIRKIPERFSEIANSLKIFREFVKFLKFQSNIWSMKLKTLKLNENFDGKKVDIWSKNFKPQWKLW